LTIRQTLLVILLVFHPVHRIVLKFSGRKLAEINDDYVSTDRCKKLVGSTNMLPTNPRVLISRYPLLQGHIIDAKQYVISVTREEKNLTRC
jgi:hypothetical protein